MTSNQKKMAVLAVLAVLWGGMAWWQWDRMKEPMKVPLANVSGRASAQHASRAGGDNLHVNLDLLSAMRTQRDMPFSMPRNIFAIPGSEESGPSRVEADAQLPREQQSVLAELAQFHYLGFVRTEDPEKRRDLAVLTRNDDLHVVRNGETIDNHVLVKRITQDSVTLQDRDSRVEHTVLLSEEPPPQP